MAQSFDETAKKNARLFKHFVLVGKFNPYHDKLGRFTNAGGATSFTYRPGVSTAHNRAIEREKKRIEEEEKKKGVAGCKTVEEVQQKMKEKNWFKKYGPSNINLSGVDLESAKSIYEAYDQVFERYPQLVGKFVQPVVDQLGSNIYANCALVSGRVTVNSKYYGNSESFKTSYEADVKSGYHPVGTNWKGVVTHEIGHAIDGYLSRKGVKGSSLYDTYLEKAKPLSKQMRSEVNKAAKTKIKDTDTNVSRYATKNHFEWFAECFAEVMTSSSPRPVATEFGKQLDEIMKGVQ